MITKSRSVWWLALALLLLSPALQAQTASAPLAVGLLPAFQKPYDNGLRFDIGAEAAVWYRFGSLPIYADASVTVRRTQSKPDLLADELRFMTLGGYLGAGVYLPILPFANLRVGGRAGYGQTRVAQNDLSGSEGAFGWSLLAGLDVPFGQFALTAQAGVNVHLNTYLGIDGAIGIIWSPGAGAARAPREPRAEETLPTEPEPLLTEEEPEQEVAETEPGPAEDLDGAGPRVVATQTVEETGEDLQLLDAGFATVFPVFYRYYVDHPIGRATLRNDTRREITDIRVSVNIPRFMDLPQQQQLSKSSLAAGEEIDFDLSVLFNDDLLGVTEGTRVAAAIDVSFEAGNVEDSYSVDTILDVANRNAMTWDDTRKAASFVTAKDPAVLTFAKQVSGIVRTGGRSAVNTNLRTGMALLESMNLHGISYVIDPTTPYAELSDNAQAIDFLQFPTQTFTYGAGDCDDLSICYAANLEAVGVPAAFVTIPGHIYAALDTGVPEDEIAQVFPQRDEIIVHGGTGWVPVEVTVLDRGFNQAWEVGARQWRENQSRGRAELIPIQTAWAVFEPIGFDTSERQTIRPPDEADLLRAYLRQLEDYVAEAIQPQIARVQARISSTGGSPRDYNRMGVVYAKYEMIDEAEDWFGRALESGPLAAAYLNLGHLKFMKEEYIDAIDYYDEARELDPDDPRILLAEARAHHELENYGFAISYYEQVAQTAPALAEQFSYLQFRTQEIGRASDAAVMNSIIIWGEDEE